MEISEHLAAVRRDGDLLAAAAARADLDVAIPPCPEWRMRDLVLHIGEVHRWAAAHVAQSRMTPIRDIHEVAGPVPDDSGLIEWFRDGHSRLLATLESADPDTKCWTFLSAPSPVSFWARRQAHETGIHRADAESPDGSITPFPADLAADGIDELLFGFLRRRPADGPPADPGRTLVLRATDIDREWWVRVRSDAVEVDERGDEPDCAVRGAASDLHLLLWNRRTPDGLDVQGDDALLGLWREIVQIHSGSARRPRPVPGNDN